MQDAMALLTEWMEDAGMRSWVDIMGNVHGRVDAPNGTEPVLLLGSHFVRELSFAMPFNTGCFLMGPSEGPTVAGADGVNALKRTKDVPLYGNRLLSVCLSFLFVRSFCDPICLIGRPLCSWTRGSCYCNFLHLEEAVVLAGSLQRAAPSCDCHCVWFTSDPLFLSSKLCALCWCLCPSGSPFVRDFLCFYDLQLECIK